MDSALFPAGADRCSPGKFYGWIVFCLMVLGWGVVGALVCIVLALNQTAMNDYFAFGLWIVFDLAVIALGAGAFFTGFLTYILRKDELKSIINTAVIIGFICYSGAVGMLGFDIGQPLRGWFGFWHANVHSMLTEVMFCITCYLGVLTIEYLPLILENRKLNQVPEFHFMAHNMHQIMALFAGTGTFLSFFHQGSLGGMYGVLFARPFAFREGIFIWPWTFFLFIWSAIASGPCLTILVTMITEKVSGKKLVKQAAISLLAKISGWMLATYLVAKIADTLYWGYVMAPAKGLTLASFYREGPYGMWLLFLEIGVFGIIPALILTNREARENRTLLAIAAVMNCTGVCINRFVFTVVSLAIPVMPFEKFASYFPTWQEWSISFGMLAYGCLIFSLSYRYLPVFPHEHELNAGNGHAHAHAH
ncbi:MAG: polysulfide reductase NrfD [Deltaproteobacteria bacterium]|nr:polysulfide reductase NrfD [Deltaproteobacteria bacterium]